MVASFPETFGLWLALASLKQFPQNSSLFYKPRQQGPIKGVTFCIFNVAFDGGVTLSRGDRLQNHFSFLSSSIFLLLPLPTLPHILLLHLLLLPPHHCRPPLLLFILPWPLSPLLLEGVPRFRHQVRIGKVQPLFSKVYLRLKPWNSKDRIQKGFRNWVLKFDRHFWQSN